ncbi:hypothetical protein H2200_001698 [Cladophialophora chaetospira]|uniref:Uncharacterized protein n=1 Tax=Cladophialophora chaetospira TaxID=386627 RepID=A0AA39CNA0_9EURO|nr:hypothetical protein H2200_001698 [Cladophialophora chaetospira]
MKPRQLRLCCLLVACSRWALADQKPRDADLTQATTPQISFEEELLSSNAAANIRSVVLEHIANVTALLTEEYLKGLVTSGMDAFGTNGSTTLLNLHNGRRSAKDRAVASDGDSPPQPSVKAPESDLPLVDNEATRLVVSTAEDKSSDQAQPVGPKFEADDDTQEIAEPQMLASCPCNCNNPTTPCCIKICVHRLKAQVDQQPLPPVVESAPHQKDIAEPQTLASCPCNCNNPTTPCCIKLCVHRLKAQLDQQLLPPAMESTAQQGQKPLSDTEELATSRAHGADAGLVTLKTSMGTDWTVKAESDLALYASFISHSLVHDLGLASEIHPVAGNAASTVVIKDQIYQVVGTVPIAVEAYTQKNFAFGDLFYVIESSQETVGKAAPELVFGIDHVRQAGGLALKASFVI